VVAGQQAASDGLAGPVVVPDGGGPGKDALQDADQDASGVWPPWRSRSSWPLRVPLTDSGPELGLARLDQGGAASVRLLPAAAGT
jgi:hypothetical protein